MKDDLRSVFLSMDFLFKCSNVILKIITGHCTTRLGRGNTESDRQILASTKPTQKHHVTALLGNISFHYMRTLETNAGEKKSFGPLGVLLENIVGGSNS